MPKTGRKPKTASGKTAIQSVLVPKSKYSEAEAKAWIKKHKFYSGGMDESGSYYRFRQYDPEHFSRMRTKSFPGGGSVKVVYGVVK